MWSPQRSVAQCVILHSIRYSNIHQLLILGHYLALGPYWRNFIHIMANLLSKSIVKAKRTFQHLFTKPPGNASLSASKEIESQMQKRHPWQEIVPHQSTVNTLQTHLPLLQRHQASPQMSPSPWNPSLMSYFPHLALADSPIQKGASPG